MENENATDIKVVASKEPAVSGCMGLLDCGAMDTVGGYELVEALADRSRNEFGDEAVKVDPSVNPIYWFGNQQKEVCLSEVKRLCNLWGWPAF